MSRNLVSTSNFVEFRDSRIYTLFEASHFGCRKTIFDVTKVIYNTYSCAISGMSREMMKINDRDNAKCRKSELGDIDDIIKFVLNDNKTN